MLYYRYKAVFDMSAMSICIRSTVEGTMNAHCTLENKRVHYMFV